MKSLIIFLSAFTFISTACQLKSLNHSSQDKNYPFELSDEEWKKRLSEDVYHILREKGTEPSFSSDLLNNKVRGIYTCAGCNEELFSSSTKFESGTGWPSFYGSLKGKVAEEADTTFGWSRVEILCANCGGHLGHVFNDGPLPTGLRYCVNGLSLQFKPE